MKGNKPAWHMEEGWPLCSSGVTGVPRLSATGTCLPPRAPTRTPPPAPVQQEILEGRRSPHTTLCVMAVNRLKSSPKAPQSP